MTSTPSSASTPKKPAVKAKTKKSDSKASKGRASKAISVPILRLPPEIVLLIDNLLELADRLALCRTNRKFYLIINPEIYRDNVKLNNASCLFWGADQGQLGTLKHALAAGADLNASGPVPRKAGESDSSNDADEVDNQASDGNDADPGAELFEESLEARPQPSCTPLHLAAKSGHREVVEWLLDNGADIDAPSYRVCECQSLKSGRHSSRRLSEWPRWRALHVAMCNHERSVAELLIFRGASLDLDATPGHNHTALHSASAHALIPIIKLLALNDINLDVNQRDAWDNTALHYTSEIWSPRDSDEIRDTITKLLALGADLEAHNENGHTPLLNACFRGNFAVAHRLVNIGANPDPHGHIPNFRDYRPLYYCMQPRTDFFDMDEAPVKHDEFEGNRVTLIKALVDAGADVNARFDKRGHRGVTPLMLACELAEPRAVAALVQSGAEIHAQDRSGRTALCYAVTVRQDHRGEIPEIATILLRHGARMDLEEDPNPSPLDTAVKHTRWGEDDVLEVMLKVADERNVTEAKLKSTMRVCASSGGNHKALKLLLDFADRVYNVTDADVKEYLGLTIRQCDSWSQIETFNCLMDFGRAVYTNEMLLLMTIMQQNRELSLAVMQRGVSICEPRFHGGQTYLHLACQWGDLEVVKALLERGADVDVFDHELRTPLSIAVGESFTCVAVELMKEVADPFIVPPDELLQELFGDEDEDEWRFVKRRYLTAFDIAIRDARLDILEDMLSRYGLPEIPPKTRFSYVHRACQHPNPAILKLLLEKGADPAGGEDCPNPPAVQLIRRVWDQPRLPDTAVSLLQMADVLLKKHMGTFPWDLVREIALYKTDDPDRKALRDLVMAELGITIEYYTDGAEPVSGFRGLGLGITRGIWQSDLTKWTTST
ncbi:ankyrin repeat-containing domain protein [Chaetomium strumarium]|uniref:Ankyrin repeat-containing domain protein n=1 Tax=Chaetomium strumarium TaxID=1170767 RepID=A0AAJ0GUP5_9PEZI|nr:ankyrin repeat-containing domain protein [Chaetomium strumarium]